jgi:molybdopterin molybdotransferase
MGTAAHCDISNGETVIVHTGGMIPPGADAVVQIEHTQIVDDSPSGKPMFEIEVFSPVAVGQNVLQPGEDIMAGSLVLSKGHQIRSQDLGGLLALGITQLKVAKKPRVAILATGDEVIDPAEVPDPGQIRDINSYTVGGLTHQSGGIPVYLGISSDDLTNLKQVATEAIADYDMLVISAGSSVSTRDITVDVVDQLGKPGVLLHGVATRPGKPTIIGVANGRLILGLPGNPVSALVQFKMFGMPAIYHLQGLHTPPRRGIVWARIKHNIASESGREDYVAARLYESDSGLIAEPVFGKSNLIYTLVNADGLIKIPLNKGGLSVGEWVEVTLF